MQDPSADDSKTSDETKNGAEEPGNEWALNSDELTTVQSKMDGKSNGTPIIDHGIGEMEVEAEPKLPPPAEDSTNDGDQDSNNQPKDCPMETSMMDTSPRKRDCLRTNPAKSCRLNSAEFCKPSPRQTRLPADGDPTTEPKKKRGRPKLGTSMATKRMKIEINLDGDRQTNTGPNTVSNEETDLNFGDQIPSNESGNSQLPKENGSAKTNGGGEKSDGSVGIKEEKSDDSSEGSPANSSMHTRRTQSMVGMAPGSGLVGKGSKLIRSRIAATKEKPKPIGIGRKSKNTHARPNETTGGEEESVIPVKKTEVQAGNQSFQESMTEKSIGPKITITDDNVIQESLTDNNKSEKEAEKFVDQEEKTDPSNQEKTVQVSNLEFPPANHDSDGDQESVKSGDQLSGTEVTSVAMEIESSKSTQEFKRPSTRGMKRSQTQLKNISTLEKKGKMATVEKKEEKEEKSEDVEKFGEATEKSGNSGEIMEKAGKLGEATAKKEKSTRAMKNSEKSGQAMEQSGKSMAAKIEETSAPKKKEEKSQTSQRQTRLAVLKNPDVLVKPGPNSTAQDEPPISTSSAQTRSSAQLNSAPSMYKIAISSDQPESNKFAYIIGQSNEEAEKSSNRVNDRPLSTGNPHSHPCQFPLYEFKNIRDFMCAMCDRHMHDTKPSYVVIRLPTCHDCAANRCFQVQISDKHENENE